jgi:hypothetical protein
MLSLQRTTSRSILLGFARERLGLVFLSCLLLRPSIFGKKERKKGEDAEKM